MKNDIKLKDDILDELCFEPSINETDIGVLVKNGVVTLTGHVDSYTQKLAAERVAMGIDGVKAVAEDITVNLPTSLRKTDTQIAEAAATAIKWNSLVPAEKVKMKVENGIIYLSGELDWSFQKSAANDSVSHLRGVKVVKNHILRST